MTRTTDLEATMNQHKAEVTASLAENGKKFDTMQEAIDRNKAETDQKLAELLALMKTLQPPTTIATTVSTPANTCLPPPTPTFGITNSLPHVFSYPHPSSHSTTLPSPTYHTTTLPSPTYPYLRPNNLQTSIAYTSFSGLLFDSQGYPIATGPTGEFHGPYPPGDHGYNRFRPPSSTEEMFQNYSDQPPGGSGGVFSSPFRSFTQGSERMWGPDACLRKLKMPLFNGEDVYGWVYQA